MPRVARGKVELKAALVELGVIVTRAIEVASSLLVPPDPTRGSPRSTDVHQASRNGLVDEA